MTNTEGRKVNADAFLAASDVLNYRHPSVARLASALLSTTPEQTARRSFEWVRDNIQHCVDFGREEVPCIASDVLAEGTGFCLTKSHLLVALLRANGIPAGFCFQRLTFDGPTPPYCLHGFVAVWLEGYGWYRCDARGNSKPGIHCEFTPGHENLVFPVQYPGECIYSNVWAEPWPDVVDALNRLDSTSHYLRNPIDFDPPLAGSGIVTVAMGC